MISQEINTNVANIDTVRKNIIEGIIKGIEKRHGGAAFLEMNKTRITIITSFKSEAYFDLVKAMHMLKVLE